MQMAFSYVVMQSLPPTLLEFENSTNAVCTLADILYGRKKYVHCANILCALIVYHFQDYPADNYRGYLCTWGCIIKGSWTTSHICYVQLFTIL